MASHNPSVSAIYLKSADLAASADLSTGIALFISSISSSATAKFSFVSSALLLSSLSILYLSDCVYSSCSSELSWSILLNLYSSSFVILGDLVPSYPISGSIIGSMLGCEIDGG